LFVGLVHAVICTIHGLSSRTTNRSYPMIRTTAPRKPDQTPLDSEQNCGRAGVRASTPHQTRSLRHRQLDLLSRARRPHLSPEGARQRLPKLPAPLFQGLGHATVVSKPGADEAPTLWTSGTLRWRAPLVRLQSWAATCASFLAAWLCPQQRFFFLF
jgi:hypothetical protein